MLHPVGPLPASVYWRRRVLALAAGLAALLLLWLVTSGGSGAGDGGFGQAAGSSSAAPTATGSGASAPSGGSPSETLAATPPAVDPGRPGDGTGGASGAGDPSGGGSGPAGTTAAAPTEAAAPVACSDAALRLTVAPGRPAYPVGATPELTLSVQNVSKQTCTRDLAASQQEVLLYAGQARVWSSNDCYPGGGRDVRTLAPGERNRFSVTWSGLSSRPSCAGTRSRVGPGSYQLVARIGTLRSTPAALTLH